MATRENGKLRYAGKVGTGFNWKTLQDFDERFRTMEVIEGPWDSREMISVKRHIGPKPLTWVEPTLEANVEFADYTDGAIMRFPSFKGLVE